MNTKEGIADGRHYGMYKWPGHPKHFPGVSVDPTKNPALTCHIKYVGANV